MEVQYNRIYRHFKGDYYLVVDSAINTDNNKIYVIYRSLYDSGELFVRPLDEFLSPVDKIKYPNATQKYRFELQEISSINKTNKI